MSSCDLSNGQFLAFLGQWRNLNKKECTLDEEATNSDSSKWGITTTLFLDRNDLVVVDLEAWAHMLTTYCRSVASRIQFSLLTSLDLSYNKINFLPSSFCTSLPSLKTLLLDFNMLTSLPYQMRFMFHPSILPDIVATTTATGQLVKLSLDGNNFLPNNLIKLIKMQLPQQQFLAKLYHLLEEKEINVHSLHAHHLSQIQAVHVKRRIEGLLWGSACGDAIGLLSEFMDKKTSATHYSKYVQKMPISYENQKSVSLTHGLQYKHMIRDEHRQKWNVGDFTDETDHMILVMESMLERGMIDPKNFSKRLTQWGYSGLPWFGDTNGKGCGSTIIAVMKSDLFEAYPSSAAEEILRELHDQGASNGAITRTAIVGTCKFWDMNSVISSTTQLCHVTHADPRCLLSCIAISSAIALMLQHADTNWPPIDELINQVIEIGEKVLEEEIKRRPWKLKEIKYESTQQILEEWKGYLRYYDNFKDLELDDAISYTFKTMAVGFTSLRMLGGYPEQLLWSQPEKLVEHLLILLVLEGGDSDANCCVAGALLGTYLA